MLPYPCLVDSLTLVLIVLLASTLAGVAYRLLRGRGHEVKRKERIDLSRLPTEKNGIATSLLGKHATLIQFSTQYCGQCPGVRRQLSQLEYRLGGISFLEVDITDRIDIAAHFGISQTPTVFVLNQKSELVYRIGGVPNLKILNEELAKLGAK